MYHFELGAPISAAVQPDGTVSVVICYEHGDADFTVYETYNFTLDQHQEAGRFITAVSRCSQLDETRDVQLLLVEIAPLFDDPDEAKDVLYDFLKRDRVYAQGFASFSIDKITIWKDGQQFLTTLTNI